MSSSAPALHRIAWIGILACLLLPRVFALALLLEAEVRAAPTREPHTIVVLGGGSGRRIRKAAELHRRWPGSRLTFAGTEPELVFLEHRRRELHLPPARRILVISATTREAVARLAPEVGHPAVVITHGWHAHRVRYLWIRETWRPAPTVVGIENGPMPSGERYKLLLTLLLR